MLYLKEMISEMRKKYIMNEKCITKEKVINIIHNFFLEEINKLPINEENVLDEQKCRYLFTLNKNLCNKIDSLL